MYYQLKLHDVFAGKSVAARARRAAFYAAAEADAEIARLHVQLAESRQQADALFKTGMSYCDKIETLQAQVDALAVAGKEALAWMESAWDRIDGEWGPCGRTLDEECEEGREPEIAWLRDALAAVGR